MKRILILVNPDKPGARAASQSLQPWLEQRVAVEVRHLADGPLEAGADLVVVLGGDGSILKAGRLLAGREVPVVGINLGKLGYLAEFSSEEFCEKFDEMRDLLDQLVDCSGSQLTAIEEQLVQAALEQLEATADQLCGSAN